MAPTTAPAAPVLAPLPPLDLAQMRLWNYAGKWMASEWDNGNSPYPWRYDHVKQPSGGDTDFTLDQNGAPELQAYEGTPSLAAGLWETDVTVPKLRDGLIVAPIFLYDHASRDEVDFEFVGRNGIDVTMHGYPNGVHQQSTVKLFAGQDLSGRRMRFGIKVDEAAGYVEMYVDGMKMQRWDRSKMSFFVSNPMRPNIEMWAAAPSNPGFVYWAGTWAGLAQGEKLTLTVHGYGYTS